MYDLLLSDSLTIISLYGGHVMGEAKNKVVGNIKEAAGKVTGDRRLEARGKRQKTVGKIQEGGRKVTGAVEEAIGRAAGSPTKTAKGRAKRT